jgi:hypothetical protein
MTFISKKILSILNQKKNIINFFTKYIFFDVITKYFMKINKLLLKYIYLPKYVTKF